MAQQGSENRKDMDETRDGNEANPSPGVIGGAAIVGATAGAIVGGPLVALLGAGATAAICLRNDQVNNRLDA